MLDQNFGQQGRTNSWLHAWAEYRDGDGPWQIADASATPCFHKSAKVSLRSPSTKAILSGNRCAVARRYSMASVCMNWSLSAPDHHRTPTHAPPECQPRTRILPKNP